MKDYLKRYQSGPAAAGDQKKAKKKKKNPKPSAGGVLIVDEDPVWQKPVQIPEDEPSSGMYLRPPPPFPSSWFEAGSRGIRQIRGVFWLGSGGGWGGRGGRGRWRRRGQGGAGQGRGREKEEEGG